MRSGRTIARYHANHRWLPVVPFLRRDAAYRNDEPSIGHAHWYKAYGNSRTLGCSLVTTWLSSALRDGMATSFDERCCCQWTIHWVDANVPSSSPPLMATYALERRCQPEQYGHVQQLDTGLSAMNRITSLSDRCNEV